MKNKSQMEIMGLAIVIILIVLGMLLVIRFVVLKPQKDVKGDYTQTRIAANTMSALLNKDLYTDCNGESLATLIKDCAVQKTIYCGETSCDFMNKTIENYFNAKRGFFEILPLNAFALTNIDDSNGLIIIKNTEAKPSPSGLKINNFSPAFILNFFLNSAGRTI